MLLESPIRLEEAEETTTDGTKTHELFFWCTTGAEMLEGGIAEHPAVAGEEEDSSKVVDPGIDAIFHLFFRCVFVFT